MRPRRAGTASRNRPNRKERKTFTLSRESIALLDELLAGRKSSLRGSASAVLDDLLRTLHKERRRQAIEQAVSRYYSNASEEERAEEFQWGEFALSQFPGKEA